MAKSVARKNGNELAAAWLRRQGQSAKDAPRARQVRQQAASGEENEAPAQAVFPCDPHKGFFRV